VQQDLLSQPCIKVKSSSSSMVAIMPTVCDDVLHLLEHPSIASESEQVQQLSTSDGSKQLALEDAMGAEIKQQHSISSPFYGGSEGCMRSSSSSSSSDEAQDDADAVPEASAAAAAGGDGVAAAGDLTAAASTWAMEIRHFTDCLPITPDSVCSSSTYLSLTGAQQPAQKEQQKQQQKPQQQQHLPQLRHRSQEAAAARTCSLPHSSSSSTSLPQRCSSDGDAAAAATEAAVQASLAALQELDDLEWCPWDRVAKWLESHAAAGAGAASSEQQPVRSGSSLSDLAPSGSSSSLTAAAEASASEQQQQHQQQGVGEDPVFDAPAWWQEAVLERLEQQRQAFQGSWWSRARVLASLAATRAACALQI
jgi:hypothetical protein